MVTIRNIQPSDNASIAAIIRSCLEEFNANKCGTVYYDSSTDHLYELFQTTSSVYFVVEKDGSILGGGGIFPSKGLPKDTCELVKMYLLPEARGTGLGARIISMCIEFAKQQGFRKLYLESMPELKKAIRVYEKFGFEYIDEPLGETGHHGCDVWMMKNL